MVGMADMRYAVNANFKICLRVRQIYQHKKYASF